MRAPLLAVLGLFVLGIFLMPPAPAYGPYSRLDLISFRDYTHASIPDVLSDNLEVMRMINQLGLEGAMDKTAHDPAYELDDTACHGAAHIVGRMGFNLLGPKALLECTTQCFSGCYHGAMQGLGVRSAGNIEELAQEVNELCSVFTTTFERSECVHGAGHGFLLFTSYQLDESLAACELLETDEDAYHCYIGVFMENVIGEGRNQRFSTTDLHYPCTAYSDPATVEACYRMQPTLFIEARGLESAQQECLRAPRAAQGMCFMRLGQLSGADTADPPAETEAYCATVPGEFYDECILGGLRQVIRVNGIDPSGTAATFCKALTAPEAKRLCYAQYASELPDLFNDTATRLRICALFETPYDEECRTVASLGVRD